MSSKCRWRNEPLPAGGIPMLPFPAIHDHRVGDAPVINGVPIAVKMVEMAATLRRIFLGNHRRSAAAPKAGRCPRVSTGSNP